MDGLLKAGLESLLKVDIIDNNNNQNNNINNNNEPSLDYMDYSQLIHGVKLDKLKLEKDISFSPNIQYLNILIRNLVGKVYQVKIYSSIGVYELKKYLSVDYEKDIEPNKMVLVYDSKILENDKKISDYFIKNESMVMVLVSNNKIKLFNVFDHRYDYSFINIYDNPNSYYRGAYVYNRPCGSRRYALFVLNRFDNSNNWLGCDSSSWPVSYHSSLSYIDIKNKILSTYTDIKLIPNEEVLTTPSFDLAKKNSHVFNYNGANYYILFQNRINPKSIEIVKSTIGDKVEYWKSPSTFQHIRPYSICIGLL